MSWVDSVRTRGRGLYIRIPGNINYMKERQIYTVSENDHMLKRPAYKSEPHFAKHCLFSYLVHHHMLFY